MRTASEGRNVLDTAGGTQRSWRPVRVLATALAVLAFLEDASLLVVASTRDPRFRLGLDLVSIGFLATILLFPMVGALIIWRRPRTLVAWSMIGLGTVLGLGVTLYAYSVTGLTPGAERPFAMQALVLSQLLFVPALGVGTSSLLLLFPDDRPIGPRWSMVMTAAVAGSILNVVGTLFHVGEIDSQSLPGVANPLGVGDPLGPVPDIFIGVGNAIVSLAVILAALSLVLRYRRATPDEAAQIRWVAVVAGLAGLILAYSAIDVGPLTDAAFALGIALLSLMPIAIGFAITRYHLYDIDRLINRALVYGALTAILAGVFSAAVGLAQRLFIDVTGEKSDAAVVLTTLVVATLYTPLRKRLEAIIDRRFKYDQRAFGAYADEVRRVLAVIDPVRAAEKLAAQAVAELRVTGVAVIDESGEIVATSGAWSPSDSTTVPIPGGGGSIASLRVGRRGRRSPQDEAALRDLQEVAGLVSRAVRPAASHASHDGAVGTEPSTSGPAEHLGAANR